LLSAVIASGNRLLDLADRRAHARTPRFIDNGSARGPAGGDAFRSAVADQRASRNYWRYSDREALKIWPVEKMVGNVRNNGPQPILPVLSNGVPA